MLKAAGVGLQAVVARPFVQLQPGHGNGAGMRCNLLWLHGCANLPDHECIQWSVQGSSYWLSNRQAWQQQERQQHKCAC
jgi:hypothetical protein